MVETWISEAKRQGILKITKDTRCPSCNKLHACERHKWISEKWWGGVKRAYEKPM